MLPGPGRHAGGALAVVQVTVTGDVVTTEEGRSRAMTLDFVGVVLPPVQTFRRQVVGAAAVGCGRGVARSGLVAELEAKDLEAAAALQAGSAPNCRW